MNDGVLEVNDGVLEVNDGVLEPTPHGNPATTLSENVWSPCAVLTL